MKGYEAAVEIQETQEIQCASPGQQFIEVTEDSFFSNRLSILQPKDGPRATIDSLLLAAAIPAPQNNTEMFFEAGAGCGIVSLALACRFPQNQVKAIEIQSDLHRLAQKNAERGGLSEQVEFIYGDLTQALGEIGSEHVQPNLYHHVIANPPFYELGAARTAPDPLKQMAHIAESGTLETWIRFLTAICKPKGTLTLIHRPQALPLLLDLLKGRFGDLVLFPIYGKSGDEAKRILIQGRKGRRGEMRLKQGLILHQDNGSYSSQVQPIVDNLEPLQLGL